MQLDRTQALRYLGYGKNEPDARTAALLGECAAEIEALSTIRTIHRVYPDLCVTADTVSIGGVVFGSRDLAKTLAGCGRAVILCATLGAEADRLRLRCSSTDLAKAAVMDAAQSAYIEQVCDRFCETFRESFEAAGLNLTARYSPGYGDLSIRYQPQLLALADAPRRIGLICSDSCMLLPQKSVTAVIGLTAGEPHCGDRCKSCENYAVCRYRRQDGV